MRGPFLGVRIIRILVCWGLFWASLVLEAPICNILETSGLALRDLEPQ